MKNSKKQEEKNLQYIRKIPISLSLKNIKISNINKIKLNTSREKNHVFNFNEEHLKKYIKNQLLKKIDIIILYLLKIQKQKKV